MNFWCCSYSKSLSVVEFCFKYSWWEAASRRQKGTIFAQRRQVEFCDSDRIRKNCLGNNVFSINANNLVPVTVN